MPTTIEDRLIGSAPDPRAALDVDGVLREGLRRRRRRTGLRVGASATALIATAGVLSLAVRLPGHSVVLEQPAATEPAPAQYTSGSGWVDVRAGETLEITAKNWSNFPAAAGEPNIQHEWSTAPRKDVTAVAVGQDGAAIFAHPETPGAILADADGTQRVVARDLTHITAVAVRGGGWLWLGQDTSGARVLQRVDQSGDVLATENLESYPAYEMDPLSHRGDEIWVVAPRHPKAGPREALLATDGGDTLVEDVVWQPAHISTDPDQPPDLRRMDIPVRGGIATIALEAEGSVHAMSTNGAHTVHLFTAGPAASMPPVPSDSQRAPVSGPPEMSYLVTSAGEVARVTRLDARSHRDVTLVDPSGALWFIHSGQDGYRLDRLTP